MALGLEQRGTGRALVIFSGPAAPGDTTTAPGLPPAAKAALGPAPWIVSVNAHGPEGLQQILGFARVNRADIWLAAVVAFSAGGQKLRQLRLEGLKLGEPGALAWVAIDAMHSEKPPFALHVQTARDLAAQARAGALTFVLTHTYIQPGTFTSTVDMARLATGWPLAMPPLGQTVARSEEPAIGPRVWSGGLYVYSTGSTPADTAAHIYQARTLMPYVLGKHVRSLVELDVRPDVPPVVIDPSASSSSEPAPVVPDTGSLTSGTPGPKPARQATPEAGFSFTLRPGESIRDRIVRCCHEALDPGPMGQNSRHEVYKTFIAAGNEPDDASAEALTHVRTSCAIFVRAIHLWCGAQAKGHYRPGTAMFDSIGVDGPVTFASPSFVKVGTTEPGPGDAFFIADPADMNRAHTGIFLNKNADGSWTTAEGGGGGVTDGTLCRIKSRTIAGDHFIDDPVRKLWGWFDCTKMGLPESPEGGGTPEGTGDVWVAGIGRMPFDPDYVARVLTAENGGARSIEGLKALAVAARTYARAAMNSTPLLGSAQNPLKNGQSFQVCSAGAPPPLCMRAAQETVGGLALYRGQLISANHVAGAPWPAGKKHGAGPGLGNTERHVTYNEGKHGADVRPTSIGTASNPQNRGCLSQNGAEALGRAWGYTFGDILRFFYGADVEITIAEPNVAPPPAPAPRPPEAPRAPRPPEAPRAPRPPEAPRPSPEGDGLVAAGFVALGLAVAGAVT
jgi:hypothetical protein